MKKTYTKPSTLEVKFESQGVIATSIKMYEKTVDTANEETQLTNKGGWDATNWE